MLFVILFGARQLDSAERHEGMVAAIATEGIVKLIAALAVGIFVVYGLFGGFSDLFQQARATPAAHVPMNYGDSASGYFHWTMISLASMAAVMFLPRQFQVSVVENTNENHVRKAMWLFPLYLLLINLFILPIALAGLLLVPGGASHADSFVLLMPLLAERFGLALFVFLGGLSAATAMVIVEAVAISTMLSNNVVIPLLMRVRSLRLTQREDLGRLLLFIRRAAVIACIGAGYAYFRSAGYGLPLVELGLVSFAGICVLAPAMIGGLFWRNGTRTGALLSIAGGFTVWFYTLVIPLFAEAGWIPGTIVEPGPYGATWLKPEALFWVEGLTPFSHGMFWTITIATALYIVASLVARQSLQEQLQATAFVDTFRSEKETEELWHSHGRLADLHAVLVRTLGHARAEAALTAYASQRGEKHLQKGALDTELVRYVERLLSGVVGAASARLMISAVVKEEPLRDGLTGLPNKTQLLGELREALEASKRSHSHTFALLVLNLDRFRLVTSSLGYNIGEQLLLDAANRLKAQQMAGELVTRLPGINSAFCFLILVTRPKFAIRHSVIKVRSPTRLGSKNMRSSSVPASAPP
ncbi:hypothetical protein CAI21_20855 [Alkalilimnicola ehrlichii]|nr:hypothetical protein CAI21_20855 [Alkalilimnicola ehrlichii]